MTSTDESFHRSVDRERITTDLLGSRYHVIRSIGHGFFGYVVEAEDTILERRVAIKLLAVGMHVSDRARRVFMREARLAVQAGPAAVAVHDLIVAPAGVAIVMEYIAGGPLSRHVRAKSQQARVSRLALAMTSSLATLHERGLVHLDLHPGNVLVREDETVALADFGLARLAESAGRSRGFHEADWAAPELLKGGRGGPRSDVYAAGLLLGWMARRSGIRIAPVVARATAPDPDARFPDGGALHAVLATLIGPGTSEPQP